MHQPQFGKLRGALQINRTPNAARLSRCKANLVAGGVDAFANAIDPAEAQSDIDRLRPCDAGASGIALVESHPQFLILDMVLLEPDAPVRRSCEEFRLCRHRFHINQMASTSTITCVRGIF